MAVLTDCAGCRFGDHSTHDESSGTQADPNICSCTGDCAERKLAREAAEARQLEDQRQQRIREAIRLLEAEGFKVIPPAAQVRHHD